MNIPYHLGIIPDGNRRWARERGLPTFEGHRRSFDTAIKLFRTCRELGIHTVTFWAFSTENWQRKKKEVAYLMDLYQQMIDEFLPEARKEKVRIVHLGRKDRIPRKLKEKIEKAERETRNNNKYILNLALDYGGRDEILRAIQKMWAKTQNSRLKTQNSNKFQISNSKFSKYLDTANQPDVDLIIRTSGEMRTSGFLLWQAEYTEFYFFRKHFPDLKPKDIKKAIMVFSVRKRRFGGD